MNNTFYPDNDYRNYLAHHGVKGMKWGVRKQYPIIGRARGSAYKFSKNPVISSLQNANVKRNLMRDLKSIEKFNKRNPELKKKVDETNEARYNYAKNMAKSYGKNKKFTSGINKLINNHASWIEGKYGREKGKEYKDRIINSLTNPHNDVRDAEVFEMVKEYLVSNDKEYQRLNNEYSTAKKEYDGKFNPNLTIRSIDTRDINR